MSWSRAQAIPLRGDSDPGWFLVLLWGSVCLVAPVCRDRLLFVHICHFVLSDRAVEADKFRRYFLPSLLQLSLDTVSNVRLKVAALLFKPTNPCTRRRCALLLCVAIASRTLLWCSFSRTALACASLFPPSAVPLLCVAIASRTRPWCSFTRSALPCASLFPPSLYNVHQLG